MTGEDETPPQPGAIVARLLEPRSIALVGASDDLRKPGARVLRNITTHGYSGEVFPINPKHTQVLGLRAHSSVEALPRVPDLVILAVPVPAAILALRQCAARGADMVIMLGALALDDRAHRDELNAVLRKHSSLRMLGPSSLGVHSARSQLAASFMTATDEESFQFASSGVFIVSQSGGVGAYLFSAAHAAGLPIGDFISTGAEFSLTFADLLRSVVDRYAPRLIFAYIEGAADAHDFVAALEHARAKAVPVVILRAGTTPEGRNAIARHSGLPPWDDEAWHDSVAGTGAVTCSTIEQAIDTGRAITHPKRPRGDRVSIVAAAGGAAILMTDAAIASGLRLARWTDSERRELAELLPHHAIVDNPIDATGAIFARLSTLRAVLQRCIAHVGTDIVVFTLGNMPHVDERLFQEIAAISAEARKLVAVIWAGGSSDAVRRLAEHGVLAFDDPVRAAQSISTILVRQPTLA
ncbi:CoA-binding protein [Ruicaihuangia caeni]|uniref:CoA-binding protein n=1 Tax=Ruicaihuangia caeni TaxID=3042517 RepID=A0AAW6T8N4_9MICO|nr:CoA-binding protein [Klugiella sp. YN-L-19]MDI2098713.1 CoA-binding protein [Klugiella sp. YN-L-19]